MCRILLVHNPAGIDPNAYLNDFRTMCAESQEYQGHGWGCTWRNQNQWAQYHNINPIWEDSKSDFPKTTLFLVHARSAFRDEGIVVENNMPFVDERNAFIFNGELRGVKVKAEGRIGAEKIFNYIKRFDKGDMSHAINRATGIIVIRSHYIRAMNFVLATPEYAYIYSLYSEDEAYFQMQQSLENGTTVVSSRPIATHTGAWQPIANKSMFSIKL